MRERIRQALTVLALGGLVAFLPGFLVWCGPYVYLYNREICERIGLDNLWHALVLLCGLMLCAFRPQATGLRLGAVRDHLKLIGWVAVGAWTVSAVAASLAGDHPFRDAPVGMYLLTPAGEELIFRGFSYAVLLWAFPGRRTRLGLSYPVIGSALLFGAWHLSMAGTVAWAFVWIQFAYTALAGLLLGLVRERTGSVLPGVAAHMGANFLVAVI